MSTPKPRCLPKIPAELVGRVEDMIADECPLKEIARTLNINSESLARDYPHARSPSHERGQQAALVRRFNRIPNTLHEIRKTK